MEKINLLVVYQVIMHYRVPFYRKMQKDEQLNFSILYGEGKPGTKLVNANLDNLELNREKVPGFRIDFKGNSFPFSPLLAFRLFRKNPQVILAEGSSSIINGTIAFFYAKIFHKKFIWWSLGQLEGKKHNAIRRLISKWEHIIEKNADAIFTYSTKGKKYFLSRGIEEDKIFVGVNVLDAESRIKENKEANEINFPWTNKFNIVFIGTITKEKNLELVIDALSVLNVDQDKFVFHIIGDGKHRDNLENYIKYKLVSENSVIFHGRINKGGGKIMEKCDLMLLPGLGGLAICEGMICSLPIITGNADGTEYDLVDEGNGFIFPDMTVDDIVKTIKLLHNNPAITKELGANSYKKITEEFTFNNYYASFKSALNFVIKK